MRINFLAGVLALASLTIAKTHYVTRYHYVTVDANGLTIDSNIVNPETSEVTESVTNTPIGSDNSWQATTLSTIRTTSASFVEFKLENSEIVSTLSTNPTAEVISQTKAQTPTQAIQVSNTVISIASEENTSQSTPGSHPASATTYTVAESGSSIYSEISSSRVDANFAKTILDAHNSKRQAHSASALSWSDTLFTYAQNYANAYTCGSSLVHSGGDYGENLAYGYSTGVAAVEAWYSEGVSYDYSEANVLDHFTQIIWKTTSKLGCAYQSCGDGLYVICSYDPAGNYVGEESQNLSAD